jgi:hypothetical protein
MKQFEGVYLGLAPVDMDVPIGEVEVTIDSQWIKTRFATGDKIEETKVSLAIFTQMSEAEIAKTCPQGSGIPERTLGFKRKSHRYPKLLFLQDPDENEYGLIILTGGIVGEYFGPITLYSPLQTARGDYDKEVLAYSKEYDTGVIPRIRNNGRAEN